jgi:hypothetical protein
LETGDVMMKKLICWIKEHEWEIERVMVGRGVFYDLAWCKRCHGQWWMKGELGQFRGVRFVMTQEKDV